MLLPLPLRSDRDRCKLARQLLCPRPEQYHLKSWRRYACHRGTMLLPLPLRSDRDRCKPARHLLRPRPEQCRPKSWRRYACHRGTTPPYLQGQNGRGRCRVWSQEKDGWEWILLALETGIDLYEKAPVLLYPLLSALPALPVLSEQCAANSDARVGSSSRQEQRCLVELDREVELCLVV